MTTRSDVIADAPKGTDGPTPPSATLGGEQKRSLEQITLLLFITVPFLALLAAVPLAWGWGVSWLDLGLLVFFYYLGCHGITIGFHRYFTHGSFKAKRPLRIALAIMGSLAVEGPLVRWVADHRKHHKFSDAEGDPTRRGGSGRRSRP